MTRTLTTWVYFCVIVLTNLAWLVRSILAAPVSTPHSRDCCDELISATLNVESNQVCDGFTLQCEECSTWWRYIQGGAYWWKRVDTNERRAVELREEIGLSICGDIRRTEMIGIVIPLVCNLPREHAGDHQQVGSITCWSWNGDTPLSKPYLERGEETNA